MSDGTDRPAPLVRGLEALPVLAALAVHAVAHGRWLLAVPLMVAVGAVVLSGVAVRQTPAKLLGAGALGVLAGGLLLFVGEPPPDSPIPPQVLSPLCGALAGMAALCVLSRRRLYAWIYACLLAVLSLDVQPTWGVLSALLALLLSLLAVAFVNGGLARAGARGAVAFGAFVVLVAGLGLGITRAVRSGEGLLMNAFLEMMKDPEGPSGPGLQTEIGLSTVSRVRGGKRALMELSGARPTYLRTNVFDDFNGARWTTSPALAGRVLDLQTQPESEPERVRELGLLLLEPLGAVLPAPAGTRKVEGASVQALGGWVLRAAGVAGSPLTLRIGERELLPPEPPPGPALTALPRGLRDELRPFALELTRDAATPRQQAEALARHFRSEHEYSLSVDLSGEGSPLAVLIRERRPAYCSYFASAMVALLRTLDVPARVVGGFAPEEVNPLTGNTLVRERDAHAWVEAYLPEEGRFVAFDPTPWASREEALGVAEDKAGLLGNVLGAVGSVLRRAWAAARSDPSGFLWRMVKSPFFFVPVVGFFGWRLFGGPRARSRAQGPRAAMQGADAAARAAYGLYLRALKRGAGLEPGPTETDDELLARLRAARGDEAAARALDFLARYREVRYRGAPAGVEPLPALVSKLELTLRGRGAKR